jgi:DNA-binding ferritin-like protein (Dps family)
MEHQADKLKRLEELLERVERGEAKEEELNQIEGEEVDNLLDKIIAGNEEALAECEELDVYLDNLKGQL